MRIDTPRCSLLACALLAACAPVPPPGTDPEPVAEVRARDSVASPPPERTLEERWREPFAVEVSGNFPERPPRPPVVVFDADAVDEPAAAEVAEADPATAPAPGAEAPPAPAPRPAASARSHRVTAGDTLFGLARRYGVSVTRLREANDLPDDTIRVGQTLRIPAR
ncbi:MAG: LysM peptidoglycan-binding domain-containing protein [Longimicrobiaceae bacterium]